MPTNITIFVPVPDKWTPAYIDTLYELAVKHGFTATKLAGSKSYEQAARKVAIGKMIAAIADGTLTVTKG